MTTDLESDYNAQFTRAEELKTAITEALRLFDRSEYWEAKKLLRRSIGLAETDHRTP